MKYFLHSMKQQYSAKLHLCNTYICSFSFIYKKKNKPLNISFGTDLRPKSSCNISNLSHVLLQAIVFILYCEVSHEFVGRLLLSFSHASFFFPGIQFFQSSDIIFLLFYLPLQFSITMILFTFID